MVETGYAPFNRTVDRTQLPLLLRGVLEVLKSHITEGEWEDVKAGMPKNLASLLP
ncbi:MULTISPECIES: hypothetical protein [unclassified Nonomuraea]|uniref:hypothetical protein n=1 Tax=unclassified Nonomuraea TaxID=2593643 RepID=UPI0033C9FA24